MENLEGAQFLHQKDPTLHTSQPVEHEMERKKIALRYEKEKTDIKDKKVSQKPADKISDWLEVIKQTHTGHRDDPRVLHRIKEYYHREYVINEKNIQQSYWNSVAQKMISEGRGGDLESSGIIIEKTTNKEGQERIDYIFPENLKKPEVESKIADQESTLDNWVDYLSSPDADAYPMWAKYWAFSGMLKLSTFDKEKHAFGKRDKTTVAPFADLNREALAYVIDIIDKKAKKEHIALTENNPELQQLLQGENFGKLYAYAIEKVTPTEKSELETTEGKWVKYPKNSDHMPLVQSLQGFGTGWCTAGESTAQTQLQGGDFYVYYSNNKNGEPNIPRVAIRMSGNSIGEVRGIAKEQNLDPYIGEVAAKKLSEFPDGASYEKKSADMKQLTALENKIKKNITLTKEELVFLYEIDSPIQGFGYQRDPRIQELLDQRNPNEDILTIFDCSLEQIAHGKNEVNQNTKVYLGEWNVDVFQTVKQYPNIKHLYESFPDKKIFMMSLETDPNISSPEKAEEAIKQKNIYLYDWGKDILNKTEFSKTKETYNLVRFTVKQLGFPNGATTDEIYSRAEELGLELCPAEVGPHLRLQYTGKELMFIAMKQIADRYGFPLVFGLGSDGARLGLDSGYAEPSDRWYDHNEFVFRFRKLDS